MAYVVLLTAFVCGSPIQSLRGLLVAQAPALLAIRAQEDEGFLHV